MEVKGDSLTPRKQIGLALGSGAARGLAHIGVLAVLEREGIPVDMIAGTSVGAVIGALYAGGKRAGEIKKLAIESQKKIVFLIDPSLPRTGLIKGEKLKHLLAQFIGGDIEFSDLKLPFACVTTDIDTGEEVVIDRGSVLDAVRASMAIPGVFTLVRKDGDYLVDGGLVDPVPVSVVKRMGADFVIAVNVIPGVAERVHHAGKTKVKEPGIIQVLMQAIFVSSSNLVRSSSKGADIIIEPEVADIGVIDFRRAEELIRRGETATEAALPEIKNMLNR